MKETTLTHWKELSLATKTLLQEKHALKLIQSPEALELLAQVSQLIATEQLHKTLLLTLNISDAILIRMLLAEANPELKLHLILADTPDSQISFNQADITIIPYPLFSLERIRQHSLPLLDLDIIMIDEAIPANFLHDLLFVDELNRSLLAIENESLLLASDFTLITQTLTANIHSTSSTISQVQETTVEVPQKITLKKKKTTATQPNDPIEVPTKTDSTKRKKATKTKVDEADVTEVAVEAQTTVDTPKTKHTKGKETEKNSKHSVTTDLAQDSASSSDQIKSPSKAETPALPETPFIALVPKNLQRQYIRDYIRTHHLQHLLIVTHNRQSARLLEKYLYRARIRSRVVHEKINDETATSLFDRYNKGQFTAFILMHRVIEEFASKIEKCDSVMFLDFPTVYSEYAERFEFIQNHYKPAHFISIATENDKAWIQSFTEEYPQLGLPIIPIDIEPPKRREPKDDTEKKANHKPEKQAKGAQKKPRNSKQTVDQAEKTDHKTDQVNDTEIGKNVSPQNEESVITSTSAQQAHDNSQDNPHQTPSRERSQKNRKAPKRTRSQADESQENSNNNNGHGNADKRQNRRSSTQRGQARNNNPRNDRRNNKNHNSHQSTGDSQSDFFNINQDEIVNRNRLPFESGSFEANIARENRRRGRDPFGVPGGIGQSTNGNFIQNITQGYGNGNGNSGNGGNNSDNNRRTQRRPRTKNNRKK
ncbi:hypothetical protein [Ignatzschineria ureiclastica]|nr:hypothetical protein [Ignatzschineria ureiclastica]